MTPSEYAATELSIWEQALREQREAERELETVRRRGPSERIHELLPEVRAARLRADLLLADAVKVKCTYRDAAITAVTLTSVDAHPEQQEEPGTAAP
jgi:hypothetical protein